MLEIFIDICRDDYVGSEDISSKRKLVHEICKIISVFCAVKSKYKTELCDNFHSIANT